MLLFMERCIRERVNQCCNRETEVNNKNFQNYNPRKHSSYIPYLDANNLYGWTMCESFPNVDFEWVENVVNFHNYFHSR